MTEPPLEELAFDLPAIEEADETVGIGDEDDELLVLEDDDDPFDDVCAVDLPLDLVLSTTAEEGSAIGDESLGIEEGTNDEVGIDEGSESLLDDGRPDDAMGVELDEELGLDPLPGDLDDGGVEGLDDAAGERVDEFAFPPLDGDENDDEELDVGIHIEPQLDDAH